MEIHKGKIHHQDIAPKTEPVNASTFFKCDRCDFKSDNKSCVEHHMKTTHRELHSQYCNVKVISIISMYTYILIISLFEQHHLPIHCQDLLLETSLFMYLAILIAGKNIAVQGMALFLLLLTNVAIRYM